MSSGRYSTRASSRKGVERIIPIQIEDAEPPADKNTNNPAKTESAESLLDQGPSTSSLDEHITSHIQQLDISAEDKVSESEELPKRTIAPYNVPEKIIIVIDRARDEVFSYFELTNGQKFRPLQMVKNSLSFFVHNKSRMNPKHQFALMVLNESSASWILDFTSRVKDVLKAIDKIEECDTEDIFDLTSVFNLIAEKIDLPEIQQDLLIPPPYVVRTVFLYGRSFTMPEVTVSDTIDNYLQSPYFTFDVAMTHEIPDASNKVELISRKLQELDTKGFAYFFPVSRSSLELHLAFAKLLAHPLQRALQKDCDYRLEI